MAIYRILFSRTVLTSDYVTREIEAESDEAAQAIAEAMASDFNLSCPDDCEAGDAFDCGPWDFESAL